MPHQASTPIVPGRAQYDEARSPAAGDTTVLVASRSGLVQVGMATLLGQLPQYRQVGTVCDPDELTRAMSEHAPDVLVLDMMLAVEVNGCCRREHHPRVLLLSNRPHASADPARGEDYACGLVTDTTPLCHIRATLKIIGACSSARLGNDYCTSCPLRASLRPQRLPLSEREQEVFRRIGQGETNQQIAALLGRSVKTIETHRENMKRKLGLESGAALVEAAIAWRRGDTVVPSELRTGQTGRA